MLVDPAEWADGIPNAARWHVMVALSELAPIERKLRRHDVAIYVAGLIACASSAFGLAIAHGVLMVAFFALLLTGNAVTTYARARSARRRRETYAWLVDVGNHLLELDDEAGP